MCNLPISMAEIVSKYKGNSIDKKGYCKVCGYTRDEYHNIELRIISKLEMANKPLTTQNINKVFLEHLKDTEYCKTPLERNI